MERVRWREAAVFGALLLIVLLAIGLMSPWLGFAGQWMRGNAGMAGMMSGIGILAGLWMLVTPLAFVAALILLVRWLARPASEHPAGGGTAPASAIPCPHCGRFVQVGWRACPYCAGPLGVDPAVGGVPPP